MRKIFLLVIINLFFLNFSLLRAEAVGVGATPSFLEMDLREEEAQSETIKINNISQEPALYEIYPDELGEWISLEPDNFRLEAGEAREVRVVVRPQETGQKATHISILARPLDRRSFNAASGIKIPLRLSVQEAPGAGWLYFWIWGWLLLEVGLIVILLLLIRNYLLWRGSLKQRILHRVNLLLPHKARTWNPLRGSFWRRIFF